MKLNLGSGIDRKEGYIHIDFNPLSKPDVIHNLNEFPYPFDNEVFDEIIAFHVIEHLDRPFDVMKELHRILKSDGILHIKVPHFSRGFTHAEHAHGFDITFPLYFNSRLAEYGSGYFGVNFELKKMYLTWFAHIHLLPALGYGSATIGVVKFLNLILSFLANLSPAFMSRIWCYWFGGFDEIEYVFVKKV